MENLIFFIFQIALRSRFHELFNLFNLNVHNCLFLLKRVARKTTNITTLTEQTTREWLKFTKIKL